MAILFCEHCGGEGRIWKSRYGGTDPDVWDAGQCGDCDGSGNRKCEARGCDQDATWLNEDGEALCTECMVEPIAQ